MGIFSKNKFGKLSVNHAHMAFFDFSLNEHYANTINHSKSLLITNNVDLYKSTESEFLSTPEKLRPFHVKFIDLSKYEFDWAEIRLKKNITFKSVSRLETMQKVTKYIADARENVYAGKALETAIYDAFDAHFHNFDFFKYKEKRYEYVFVISLIKDKKTVERLKFNFGELAMIYCPNFFNVTDLKDSKETRPTRASNTNPVYLVENIEYLAEFNPISYYVETVEQCRLINEMQEI